MSPGQPLPLAVGRAAAFLKVLAHEGRLEILCLLADGARPVGEVARVLNLSQTSVSQQLMRLRAEGLVSARRDGRHIRYALDSPETAILIRALQEAFCPEDEGGAGGS